MFSRRMLRCIAAHGVDGYRSAWIPGCGTNRTAPTSSSSSFALYEATDWAAQYEEADALTVVLADGNQLAVDLASDGDEALNRIFFEFLRDLLTTAQTLREIATVQLRPKQFGVQLLDSEYGSSWESR